MGIAADHHIGGVPPVPGDMIDIAGRRPERYGIFQQMNKRYFAYQPCHNNLCAISATAITHDDFQSRQICFLCRQSSYHRFNVRRFIECRNGSHYSHARHAKSGRRARTSSTTRSTNDGHANSLFTRANALWRRASRAAGSAPKRRMAATKSAGLSATIKVGGSPSAKPSAPTGVATTGMPSDQKSTIFTRMPPPICSGTTAICAAAVSVERSSTKPCTGHARRCARRILAAWPYQQHPYESQDR